jgi:hypothetical protein
VDPAPATSTCRLVDRPPAHRRGAPPSTGTLVTVTTYVNGRPERELVVRRRWLLTIAAVAAVVAVAALALGVRALVVQGDDEPTPQATALDAELRRRFDEAAGAAAAEGLTLRITSGWRTAEEQALLVAEAVATHGSEAEAHRWVLPPETSAHVQGLAIDVGPPEGAAWLAERGAAFGLCRTYANEMWHFEPVIEPGGACPPMHPDSSDGW